MRPLRHVSLYVHQLAHTGVVRNTLLLADSLRGEAGRVEIVTALPGGAVPAGVAHTSLLTGPGRGRKAEHVAAVARLRRHLERSRPDVAVSMGNHGHFTFWAAARRITGLPRVYRLSNDLRRDIPNAPAGPALKRALRPWFTRRLIADSAALVSLSDGLLPDDLAAAAQADGKLSIIPNGIDVARARALAREASPHPWLDGDIPVVLAVGRLAPQKNFGTLLNAVAGLPAGRECRLIILGDSRDSTREELLAQAHRLGIGERVQLPGTTDNIFAWMSRAAVVVQPSWWEGFSVVPLEAMAVGTPVIASRTAGAAADILADRFGLLIDPSDPAALSRAIARQLDPGSRICPGQRAENYALEDALASWHRLLHRVVQGDRGRSPAAPSTSGAAALLETVG